MVVNDNACELDERVALESIASRLAPTVLAWARSFVGAGLPAMVVNDNACGLDERGALESIASRLAPTVLAWTRSPVGAGLPAMVVNDNACGLDERGALESIASRLAHTVSRDCVKNLLFRSRECCPCSLENFIRQWIAAGRPGQHQRAEHQRILHQRLLPFVGFVFGVEQ